jgi:hypothetical protein
MHDQQQTPNEQMTVRGSFNFLYLAINGHATCFTPFLHYGFGSEALGVNGIAGLVVILLYIAFSGSPAMVTFLYVWLFMMLMQRIKTTMMRREGYVIHSRYDGFPFLAKKLVKSERAARGLEPFICAIAGILLMPYDEALGQFVLFGVVSLIARIAIQERIDNVAVQRMRDAEIEQRWLVEQNKSRR